MECCLGPHISPDRWAGARFWAARVGNWRIPATRERGLTVSVDVSAAGFLQARLLLKLPLHPQRIPPCNFRPGGVHGVCTGRFFWPRRLNAFGRHRERRLGGRDRRVTGRLHSHGCGYWCPSPGHTWQLRSNEIVQSRAPGSSWPGARRVPDDMRRAITTTGFTPGMACSRWV